MCARGSCVFPAGAVNGRLQGFCLRRGAFFVVNQAPAPSSQFPVPIAILARRFFSYSPPFYHLPTLPPWSFFLPGRTTGTQHKDNHLNQSKVANMGTRGLLFVRFHGRYYVYYNHWDSYPEGLGDAIVQEIPEDPDEYRGMRNPILALLSGI